MRTTFSTSFSPKGSDHHFFFPSATNRIAFLIWRETRLVHFHRNTYQILSLDVTVGKLMIGVRGGRKGISRGPTMAQW